MPIIQQQAGPVRIGRDKEIVQELALRREQRGVGGLAGLQPGDVVGHQRVEEAGRVLPLQGQQGPLGQGDTGEFSHESSGFQPL